MRDDTMKRPLARNGNRRPGSIAGMAVAALAVVVVAWPARGARVKAQTPQAVAPAKARVVPFEMLPTNHMLVKARINDKGPYQLVFDLGAPITLLNNRASLAAGVIKADAPRSFLMGMRGEAEVGSLTVGELTATKLPVLVLDHPTLTALAEITGRRIDGIMGFTFFARYKTTIDYKTRTMTFDPIDYEVRNLFKDLPDRLMGSRKARRRIVAPAGLWGMEPGKPSSDLAVPGVMVDRVLAGSAAERGGLRGGDLITQIDGRWTTSTTDIFEAARGVDPGHPADVVVIRAGAEKTLSIRPDPGA